MQEDHSISNNNMCASRDGDQKKKGVAMNLILILTFRKQSLTKNQPGIERLSRTCGSEVHDVGKALSREATNERASGV